MDAKKLIEAISVNEDIKEVEKFLGHIELISIEYPAGLSCTLGHSVIVPTTLVPEFLSKLKKHYHGKLANLKKRFKNL